MDLLCTTAYKGQALPCVVGSDRFSHAPRSVFLSAQRCYSGRRFGPGHYLVIGITTPRTNKPVNEQLSGVYAENAEQVPDVTLIYRRSRLAANNHKENGII